MHLVLECAKHTGRARRATECNRRGAARAAAQGQQQGETTALAPLYCRRNFRLLPAISRIFPAISRVFINGSLSPVAQHSSCAADSGASPIRRYGGNRV